MRIRDLFRREVRHAINATGPRKATSFISSLLLVAIAIAFAAVAPWLWLVLVGIDAVIFLILGNLWANKDALEASGRLEE